MAFELRSRVCLFWFQVTFRNAFLKMRVFGCAWKINFPEIIFSYFPDSHLERERERERAQSSDHSSALLRPSSSPTTTDQAPVRRPTLHWSRRSQHCADRTRSHRSRLRLRIHHADQAKIDSNAARSRLRICRVIEPSLASLSSFFSQFD